MFDVLSTGFKDAALKLKGQARLTTENINDSLDAVRRSLLDADVDFGVVKQFLENVRNQGLGTVVQTRTKSSDIKASAGEHFIQLCHQELVNLLGSDDSKKSLIENPKGPTVILLVGLQGSGKTTHAAKLANFLKTRKNKKPLLVAADVYRPAARDQLKILGERISVPVFTLDGNSAVEIAKQALEYARTEWLDTIIIDTAGRLALDDVLMAELEEIKACTKPHNILLVIDAMIGQDAVKTASAFDARLGLTGTILTKLDGDTRGGAALSIKKVTGKEIVFIGTGESLDKLEELRAEGMAGRILGMGDIVGLMDDFSRAVDIDKAEQQSSRMMNGHFDFNDFLEMTSTIQRMGPIKDVIAKTPLAGHIKAQDMDKVDDKEIHRMAAMVYSMTKRERTNPDLLLIKTPGGRSRIGRIARGSGRDEKDVRDLIEKFMQMRQMMLLMTGAFSGGGLLSKVPGLGQLNQLANLAKAAKQMGSMGNMGSMFGGGASPFGDMNMPKMSSSELAEINRMRKRKKEEKKQKRR